MMRLFICVLYTLVILGVTNSASTRSKKKTSVNHVQEKLEKSLSDLQAAVVDKKYDPEVGVNMQPNYMIRYEFDQETGDIATDEETIIIGFATQEKKGTLMLIRNDDKDKPEYIAIEMNNAGGVKVSLDVGFERDEVNTDIRGVDLANSQQHVVTVRRYNKGRSMVVTVDDYPPLHKHWTFLPDSVDTKLDKPRYIYYGRNEMTLPGEGFKGCLFRSQFNNLYPLKRVFQDPRPANIYLEPNEGIREDMCGFEEAAEQALLGG